MTRPRIRQGMFPAWLWLSILFTLKSSLRAQEVVEAQCPVKDYGAVGDGTTYDTAAIQQAIDACGQSPNGGMVVFDTGKSYLTASLTIPSGVRLNLPKGAALIAGTQREDYGDKQDSWYLLRFYKCSKCGLLGEGTIDGQASEWVEVESDDRKTIKNWDDVSCSVASECRPRLIGVIESSQVTIASVSIQDPVYWAVHVLRSEAVALVSIMIRGDPAIPNNDGIDIDGSTRVFVGSCSIDTADDAIALKTTSAGSPVNSVLVDSCLLKSRSSAFKIGSETRDDISAVLFQNSIIEDSNRGLAIQLRDSGNVYGITFSNVTITTQHYGESWWGAAEPIYVTAVPRDQNTKVGFISDITFKNIRAESESGAVFVGSVGSTLENITIDGLNIVLRKVTDYPGGRRDLRPSSIGVLNNRNDAAVYLEYANDVLIANTTVKWQVPTREEWGDTIDTAPHTVHYLSIQSLAMHDQAAHEEEAPGGEDTAGVMSLISYFKTSLSGVYNGGFLAAGDRPVKRAASSASFILILLTAVIIVGLMIGNQTDFESCKSCLPGRKGRKPAFRPLEP